MSFIQLDENALRQSIDAFAAYRAYQDAVREAQQVRGGMVWREKNGRDYLVRTSPTGKQKGLGPRTPETEDIFNRFNQRKIDATLKLKTRRELVERNERMNRALRVGRVPNLVVDLLSRLERAGLTKHLRVIGTFSLYAYETAAGVRFDSGIMHTNDIDLLWDIQRRIQFVNLMSRSEESSLIEVLKKVDKTFQIRSDQPYTAINDAGFEVDILRRLPKGGDPHPIRMSENENDFWAVPAQTAESLISSAPFSQVVVGSSGKMATMLTVHPLSFASVKLWLSAQSDREPLKRRRDRAQAEAVTALVDEYLPHLAEQYRSGHPKPQK